MSPAHVLEPTCSAIRLRLAEGTWRAGQRLETVRIAEELGVSATPVRDSLNQLAGEGLVVFVPGEGFRVPRIDERELRGLLGLNSVLLAAAIAAGGRIAAGHTPFAQEGLPAVRTANLFAAIARRSGNRPLARQVEIIGERLHLLRSREAELFPDVARELETIALEWHAGRSDACHAYHDRRIRAAARLAALLDRENER